MRSRDRTVAPDDSRVPLPHGSAPLPHGGVPLSQERAGASAGTRTLLLFAPYVVVALVNVVASFLGLAAVAALVKPFLMPLLLIPFVVLVARRSVAVLVVGVIALVFAWAGDIAPGFIGMLVFFLCMQLAYIVLFARWSRTRVPPLWTIVYALWWLVLVGVIGPHAGSLLIPVAIYGLALGSMAVLAAGTHALTTIGAALFLVSDSLLGMAHFVPAFAFPGHDGVVMLTYTAGQLLIVLGVVRLEAESHFRPR